MNASDRQQGRPGTRERTWEDPGDIIINSVSTNDRGKVPVRDGGGEAAGGDRVTLIRAKAYGGDVRGVGEDSEGRGEESLFPARGSAGGEAHAPKLCPSLCP